MSSSQNGWPALDNDSALLISWVVPLRGGKTARIRLRQGSAGFILVWWLSWFDARIEPVVGKILDDWGYAYRPIRAGVALSNHASGTAEDINALQHVLGRSDTFTDAEERKMRRKLGGLMLRGIIRWGGDYRGRKDEMHFEINNDLASAERVARRLMKTPRGRRILKANPGQRAVIKS